MPKKISPEPEKLGQDMLKYAREHSSIITSETSRKIVEGEEALPLFSAIAQEYINQSKKIEGLTSEAWQFFVVLLVSAQTVGVGQYLEFLDNIGGESEKREMAIKFTTESILKGMPA